MILSVDGTCCHGRCFLRFLVIINFLDGSMTSHLDIYLYYCTDLHSANESITDQSINNPYQDALIALAATTNNTNFVRYLLDLYHKYDA